MYPYMVPLHGGQNVTTSKEVLAVQVGDSFGEGSENYTAGGRSLLYKRSGGRQVMMMAVSPLTDAAQNVALVNVSEGCRHVATSQCKY